MYGLLFAEPLCHCTPAELKINKDFADHQTLYCVDLLSISNWTLDVQCNQNCMLHYGILQAEYDECSR